MNFLGSHSGDGGSAAFPTLDVSRSYAHAVTACFHPVHPARVLGRGVGGCAPLVFGTHWTSTLTIKYFGVLPQAGPRALDLGGLGRTPACQTCVVYAYDTPHLH
jgi:hypothetical protein